MGYMVDGYLRVHIVPGLREAWEKWYRSKGLTSVIRIDWLTCKRVLRGKWPK